VNLVKQGCGAVFRPDNPRVRETKTKGRLSDGAYPCKVLKYEFPQGAPMRVDCPPMCQWALSDPAVTRRYDG